MARLLRRANPGVAGHGQRHDDPGLEERAAARRATPYSARVRRSDVETREGFVHGAPEFVVEVAKATRYVDLGPKLADYEQAGVLEYVVHAIDPDEIFWFGQEQGMLVQRPIGGDGLYRSTVFPGLWLDPQALLKGDRQRLRAVLDLGCATPEHAEFVARLAKDRHAQGTAKN